LILNNDFTTWLAKEENIEILSEEIGIDIKTIKTEAGVGKFSADILAEEETTGRKIIIENQLEATNHSHLGQIITYASGLDAAIVIWIVKDVRDEHKQAIDWLNEHTDEDVNFFAIKMELWKIGDSPSAPKFQIISKPNDWAKALKKSSRSSEPTETKLSQLEFWNKFKDYAEQNKTKLRLRSARPQHWYSLAIGSSIAHMSFTINTQENLIACEIYIPREKELFNQLIENKEAIEKQLGEELKWMGLEGKKASRIKLSKEAVLDNTDEWESYFQWLKETGEKFQEVFGKYIKKTKLNNN
jgi:hypothetical protein